MNKANLKSYAPKARLDFIKAVTERANVLGISAAGVVPAEVRGDVALIDGREWPAKVAGQRDELIARIKRNGFEQTMDEVAYTWFNRFAALRYMEIHDYLGHGWRVLSSRDGGLPEILRHASEVTLPGLNADRAREMQLAGNQDNELYKLLLVAQCNELSRVMPFLFERIDDETELLLPENLLRTDSIVAKLVDQVPEEDWQEIEVIGWLYQFYISEKKAQVIGQVTSSEDIPAATQLFTPNWIVQYLVQNSVGRLWLTANSTSTLANHLPYYIKPVAQTPEVQSQLDGLILTRIREDGEALNPETITVLDPACGSGHILVVAYDVLKAIYLERGYQARAIPRLILEKNLYGLDIDDRAAQLAAFALVMKARADDRRLFSEPPKLNVLSLQESKGLDLDELVSHLAPFGIKRACLKSLLDAFANAKTFGSLIQISSALTAELAGITDGLLSALRSGDLYAKRAAQDLLPLTWQGLVLCMKFDAIVANPPYMGIRKMPEMLRGYFQKYKVIKHQDLYSAFIERFAAGTKPSGVFAAVTLHGWLQYSSFEDVRRWFSGQAAIETCVHLGSRVFEELSGEVVQVAAFVGVKVNATEFVPKFVSLADASVEERPKRINDPSLARFEYSSADFQRMPHAIFAFDMPRALFLKFCEGPAIGDQLDVRQGLATTDDGTYLRYWYELAFDQIGFGYPSPVAGNEAGYRWFPFNKGGGFRRWYGNWEHVLRYENDGMDLLTLVRGKYPKISDPEFVIKNRGHYCRAGVTWSNVSGGSSAFRLQPQGVIFGSKGSCIFQRSVAGGDRELQLMGILALMNSSVAFKMIGVITAGVDLNVKQIESIPIADKSFELGADLAASAVKIAKADWDSFETSWEFQKLPFGSVGKRRLSEAWEAWRLENESLRRELAVLEERNNILFARAYGLSAEISSGVSADDVTLAKADREKDGQRLVSFALGCVMGRYSLEAPGLIYAQAGNVGFDRSRYGHRFLADMDGIVPVTDEYWFEDDAAIRLREFVRAAYGSEMLEENCAWLAASLGAKAGEASDQTLRRYLADKFFKDHVQSYRKRPIYWLFSSGKLGAFQALVYLHRYNDGTLARMRAEYVVPLIAKIVSRLDMLDKDVVAASSAAARTKLQKQIEALRKKQIELLAYDEKLRHYADMRITLDLDDGVKVNYAKFGDLVAESKAITGGSDE